MSHLNMKITGRCNQNCFYCFNYSGDPDIPIKEIVHKAEAYTSVLLTGGEPFLYKDFVKLIKKLLNMRICVSILSNGSFPEIIKGNPGVFGQINVAQISLDSMDPGIHDKRRGFNGAHKKALETISLFRKLGVRVEVSMVLDAETTPCLWQVVEYCKKIGVKLILRPQQEVGVLTVDRFEYGPKSIMSIDSTRAICAV